MTDWSTPRVSPVPLRVREVSLRERALDRASPLRQLDWVLMLAVAALIAVGGLLIWSATQERQLAIGLDPQAFLKKHAINAALGVGLGTVAALVDYRALRAYAPLVYLASCIGLLAVLSPLGSTINGAHSWIVLPAGFQIQPSEFAKLAVVVGMAMLLGEKRDGESKPRNSDVVAVLSLCLLPMILVMGQPDFGTTMVFIFVILGVLAVAEAPARWIVGLLLAGVVMGVGVAPHVLKDYQ
ncbi:MAG: rod shape-determining protein RodA, partial [Frankiales bacterium]|nr:rod shape-determining protein RodA [Frankiales bacterium]